MDKVLELDHEGTCLIYYLSIITTEAKGLHGIARGEVG